MLPLKIQVHQTCLKRLKHRMESLEIELLNLKESAAADTKSSMGDKYETGREMINIEKGKISSQLNQVKLMMETMTSIEVEKGFNKCELGALVKTNLGCYFLSVAFGAVEIEGQNVFAISPGSPIGQSMLGKGTGDHFNLVGKTHEILEIA